MAQFAAALFLLLQAAADYNAEGMKALEARKYDDAVQAFTKQIAADPKDYSAHFNLGLAYSFLNRDSEAAAEYRKVLEIKPDVYQAQLNLGIVLVRSKHAAEALDVLTKAVEAKPKELRPRIYLGEALLTTGQFAKAEEQYNAARELDAKSAQAEMGLARSLARQSKVADADPHFRKAAELDAGYHDGLLELASLYEKAGKNRDAIELYRQFPDNPAARERVGQLMLETKDYSGAIAQLEEAAQKDPTYANRTALATAYIFDKQNDKALPILEKLVAEDPRQFDVRMMFARALRDQKQYLKAANQFLEAVKVKPDAREAWNDLAGCLYLSENYPQALAAFERVHQMGDSSAANYYFRAIIQDRLRDLKAALPNYKQFLELSQGQRPDEEFKARQRVRIIEKELSRK